MSRCERRLPHWDVVGKRILVIFRLHGSLPVSRIFRPANLTAGQAFLAFDRLLDNPKAGPMFLRQREIAEMVVRSIYDGESRFRRYELHAFVIIIECIHLLASYAGHRESGWAR